MFTGKFPGFATRFSFDPAQLATAKLEVSIPLATATTGNDDYDDNLRGGDFFASAKFPQARYTATRFRALGGNRYAADGTPVAARRGQTGDAGIHLDARRAAGAGQQRPRCRGWRSASAAATGPTPA